MVQSLKQFFLGGLLIGCGAISLLYSTGYISGMNSMLDTIFIQTDDFQYRWKSLWLSIFILMGLFISNKNKTVESLPLNIITFFSFFILAFGVRMAQGCTSGHGINGLARLSNRSLIAVILFFSFAVFISTNFKTLSIHKTNSIHTNKLIPIFFVILWIIYSFLKTSPKDNNNTINPYNIIAIIISALLFSSGLIYSGMYQFSIVKNFLNFNNPNWNYGLLIVFSTAVITTFIGFKYILSLDQPLTKSCEQSFIKDEECKFMLPKRNIIDDKLIIGSSLFGIGWGLTGMCPSTFPIRLGLGDPSAYLALIALFLGYQSEYLYENITSVQSNHNDIILHQFFDPPSSSFTYIVGDKKTNEVVIIDSVYNQTNYEIPTQRLFSNIFYINPNIPTDEALLLFCDLMNYNIKYLLNTHIHVDHITANNEIKKIKYIPSILSKYPNSTSDLNYESLSNVTINDNLSFNILPTPGHTKHCISLLLHTNLNNYLFSGDALLITGVGRTDLDNTESESDFKNNKLTLFNSLLLIIQSLHHLPNETYIYPAHDYTEKRVITYSQIFDNNPFISYALSYFNTPKESIKNDFLKYFTKKELSLAHFDQYDINLCVDINKMCGVIDNIQPIQLEQLWSKESGACG